MTFGPSGLDLSSRLVLKGWNAGVKRPECLIGQASHLEFSGRASMFRWADFFPGPGRWVCEPYFLNPITYICSQLCFLFFL